MSGCVWAWTCGRVCRSVYACSALRALSVGNRVNQEAVREAGGLVKLITQLSVTSDMMMRAIAVTTLIDLCVDNPANLSTCRNTVRTAISAGGRAVPC